MQFVYKNALYMRDLDLNGLTLRRLPLYPTEVRGLIHKLDKYAVYMRDLGTNNLLLRRQILCPAEVRRHMQFMYEYALYMHNSDLNDFMLGRRSLYTAELKGDMCCMRISLQSTGNTACIVYHKTAGSSRGFAAVRRDFNAIDTIDCL